MRSVEVVEHDGGKRFSAWVDGASVCEAAYHRGLGQWEVVDVSDGECVAWGETVAEALGLMVAYVLKAGE